MTLSTDLELKYNLWEKAEIDLIKSMGVFGRLVDIYVIACSIGVMEDKSITTIETSEALETQKAKTIGRNTHRENSDIREIFDFLLQNALINSKTIDLDVEERLKLAFNPDYNNKKIRSAEFLTGFANYGLKKIFEECRSQSPLVFFDQLYNLYMSLTDNTESYERLLEMITLDELTYSNKKEN